MIRFPKMHIATSVINRIMNAADGIEARAQVGAPSLPESPAIGAALDAQLATPPSGAAPDDSVLAGAVAGETSLESLAGE